MPTGFPDYYGGLTLPVTVPEGGTGYTSIDAHALLVGNGTGKMNLIEPSTLGYVLTAQGLGADPIWSPLSAASLVAGAGISITGSPPTITNTDDAYFSAAILAIAHGGTGTATPALVAGANIAITGSWPDQTIAVQDPIQVNALKANQGSGPVVHVGADSDFGTFAPALGVALPSGSTNPVFRIIVAGVSNCIADAVGNLTLAGALTLGTPLAPSQGGTGAASLAAAGIPQIVATDSATAQSVSSRGHTLYTPAGAGMYRLSVYFHVHNPSDVAITPGVTFSFYNSGTQYTLILVSASGSGNDYEYGPVACCYSDSGKAISYGVATGGGTNVTFDVYARLEAM